MLYRKGAGAQGRKGFLIRLCVVAPLRLCELNTRRPGADNIHIFHRTQIYQIVQIAQMNIIDKTGNE